MLADVRVNLGVYHLDEIFDCNRSAYFAQLHPCASMSWRTTLTLFIFLSPQFLVNHQDARDVFVECVHECTLWVIAMDEPIFMCSMDRPSGKTFVLSDLFLESVWKTTVIKMSTAHRAICHVSDFLYLAALDTVDRRFKYWQLHSPSIFNWIPSAGDQHTVGYLFQQISVCCKGIDACCRLLASQSWPQRCCLLQLTEAVSTLYHSSQEIIGSSKASDQFNKHQRFTWQDWQVLVNLFILWWSP